MLRCNTQGSCTFSCKYKKLLLLIADSLLSVDWDSVILLALCCFKPEEGVLSHEQIQVSSPPPSCSPSKVPHKSKHTRAKTEKTCGAVCFQTLRVNVLFWIRALHPDYMKELQGWSTGSSLNHLFTVILKANSEFLKQSFFVQCRVTRDGECGRN